MFALLSARSLYRFAMRITPGLSSLLFTPSLPLFATSFPPIIKSLVYKKFFARFEKYSLVRLKLNLPFTHRLNEVYIYFLIEHLFSLLKEEGKLFLCNYSFESQFFLFLR